MDIAGRVVIVRTVTDTLFFGRLSYINNNKCALEDASQLTLRTAYPADDTAELALHGNRRIPYSVTAPVDIAMLHYSEILTCTLRAVQALEETG